MPTAEVRTLLRLIILAGFAVVAYLLLSAGAARADDKPAVPGLEDIVETVAPVKERVAPERDDSQPRVRKLVPEKPQVERSEPVKAVRKAVSRTTERVRSVPSDKVTRIVEKTQAKTLKPVTGKIRPVTEPLTEALRPVTKPLTETLRPVTKPLTETLRPVTKPLTETLRPVTEPVAGSLAPVQPVSADPVLHAVLSPAPVKVLPHEPAPKPVAQPIARPVVQPLAQPLATAPPAIRGTVVHHTAHPRCTEVTPPATRHRGTAVAEPATAPVRAPLPAYLRLLSPWITVGADSAPQTWAVTSAAWLPAPAPAATAATESPHHAGRRPSCAAPPG